MLYEVYIWCCTPQWWFSKKWATLTTSSKAENLQQMEENCAKPLGEENTQLRTTKLCKVAVWDMWPKSKQMTQLSIDGALAS